MAEAPKNVLHAKCPLHEYLSPEIILELHPFGVSHDGK